MDLSGPGLSYLLLVIPTLFALTVVGQGIVKTAKQEPDGPVALGFGALCIALVASAYFFFIR